MDKFTATSNSADAIVLIPTACRDSQIAPGLSKFGGNPDLPAGFQFDFDFQFFVGQINFAQISEIGSLQPLPDHGLLSLFLSPFANQSFKAVAKYFPHANHLERVLLPPAKHPCHPCRLTPHPVQTLPASGLPSEIYQNYENEFLRRFYPHKRQMHFDTPWHQMLGFHRDIARSEQTEEGQGGQILLLQIDSDSLVSMSWGYNGQLYFWIKQADLEAKNFANVSVELAIPIKKIEEAPNNAF